MAPITNVPVEGIAYVGQMLLIHAVVIQKAAVRAKVAVIANESHGTSSFGMRAKIHSSYFGTEQA